MFEYDDEALHEEVKLAMAAAYEKFVLKWDMRQDKSAFVKSWGPVLNRFSALEINAASDYIFNEFRRAPVPIEFIELCTRVRAQRPLTEPIVSKIERMAYLILASDDFSDDQISFSEIADACQIAAVIASLKEYKKTVPGIKKEFILQELNGRTSMFFHEALNWQKDADEDKGYWSDTFKNNSYRK